MVLGAMTHVALRVRDRPRSEAFYERILVLLGYRRTAQTDTFTMWWSPRAGAITISAMPEPPSPAPSVLGLHHLAFNADSREQVDAFYRHLQTLGIPVLKVPSPTRAEHRENTVGSEPDPSIIQGTSLPEPAPITWEQRRGDYYAVLFKDPDGLCLELVYMAAGLTPSG